jgi:UDP-2-acetamido-2-deoxy-ribo-hexuluronate aminotransferase
MSVPFIDLKAQFRALEPSIRARIDAVLEHGQYIMGPEVAELEEALAAFTGARHCVTVSSGTEALLISLMALGVGPGDEVVTTAFSFAATAEVIALVGATPVFADIEPRGYNLDETALEERIGPRTKVIIPVSLYGQIADMDEINALAASHGVAVVEDAAQSFGAVYRGRHSCALSTFGCTSFFPSKPLGCYGDGGALFTDDDGLAQAAREIRVHGQSERYVHTRVGVGGRMDTLQCAIVLAKLQRFEQELERRQSVATRYLERLAHLEGDVAHGGLTLPRPVANDRTSAWAQFTIRVANREQFAARLKAAGVPTAVHYPVPLNAQPAYRDMAISGATPVTDLAARQVLSLPMSADLAPDTQDTVIAAVCAALA